MKPTMMTDIHEECATLSKILDNDPAAIIDTTESFFAHWQDLRSGSVDHAGILFLNGAGFWVRVTDVNALNEQICTGIGSGIEE